MTETTAKKLPAHLNPDVQFKPGQSGNPAGRPKGSRNKLGEKFIEDLHADWQEHGKDVIAAARKDNPSYFLRTIATLLPKNLLIGIEGEVTVSRIERVIIDSPQSKNLSHSPQPEGVGAETEAGQDVHAITTSSESRIFGKSGEI